MHFDSMREVIPFMNGCEDYLKTEGSWVHRRLCRQDGRMGCCDSSKKTRDQALSRDRLSDHVALRSFRPVGWCYSDEEMFDFTGNQTKHLQVSSVASRIASRDEQSP
jgi:hypothetical protein